MNSERTIALVGLSGTGKSTVAHLLAESLGCPARDTDEMIAAAAGRSVAELFAAEGEAAFRDREAAALAEALAGPRCVLATGGGIVLRPENRTLLHRQAIVVWLDATDGAILARLRADPVERPLLAEGAEARLAAMRADREPLYREIAHVAIFTASHSPTAVADMIRQMLLY